MRCFVFTIILLGYINSAQAAEMGDVVINEIAWMGTVASYNDEWIELKNNTNQEINLDGWILKAIDGAPEVKLTRTVLVNGFYLLERTDDNTLPDIRAEQIYTGALSNGGEKLELYDNLGNLIDSTDTLSGWPAGDNITKQTMERTASGWQTGQNPGGTPGAENSSPLTTNKLTEDKPLSISTTTDTEVAVTRSPQTLIVEYPAGVVINEIMPSPIGADEREEWIEIFNQNNFEINLSGWKITDVAGKTKIYTFSEETKIDPNNFLVLYRLATKITLNNQGDGVKLTQPDGTILDEINFEKAVNGQSYSRFGYAWAWTAMPTPGSTNAQKTSTNLTEPNPAPDVPQKQMAAAGIILNLSQGKSRIKFSYALLIAIMLTAISGVIIFTLKRKGS